MTFLPLCLAMTLLQLCRAAASRAQCIAVPGSIYSVEAAASNIVKGATFNSLKTSRISVKSQSAAATLVVPEVTLHVEKPQCVHLTQGCLDRDAEITVWQMDQTKGSKIL